MEIREATEQDIPEIIQVLRSSLGETSSQKTEKTWKYKHYENPFGKSLVLIALSGNQIVGVRAFMKWEWQDKDRTYNALRAVDTATHPKFQGQGIFKKLTLAALDMAERRGDHFVFNTPNNQSKPGYIKMGWEEIGSLKISFTPVFPFKKNNLVSGNFNIDDNNLSIIFTLLEKYHLEKKRCGLLFTPKSTAFLKWRYFQNALQNYDVFYDEKFFLAGYLKKRGRLKEYRIAEFIAVDDFAEKQTFRLAGKQARKHGAHFITFQPHILRTKFAVRAKLGPTLTLRNINLEKDRNREFQDLEKWNYDLGDLELF